MIALNVQDVKDFMARLLISEEFDSFWLCEASITTFSTFQIDGTLRPEFFDTEEAEALTKSGRTHCLWQEVKPYCFSIIKGKKTPLSFKIVFQLSRQASEQLLLKNTSSWSINDIYGLYLNLQYDGTSLICTTGTSMKLFSMDKSLDLLWDEAVITFFKKHQIAMLSV
ncbi:DUF5721 family protein [Blautia stercoris]|uniref:DUF5721 family protein n=1 Tax=Blautia stercoris TaxID=871664 RepID=UPI00355B4AE0